VLGEVVTWGDLWLRNEVEWSRYNFEEAPVPALFEMFKIWEGEALRLLDLGLVGPGYDAVIKCSHLFNLLDARGAISVSERVGYIGRVRKLARRAAVACADLRAELGYPLIKDEAARAKWVKPKEAEGNGAPKAGKKTDGPKLGQTSDGAAAEGGGETAARTARQGKSDTPPASGGAR
jgi:hypothetical protein